MYFLEWFFCSFWNLTTHTPCEKTFLLSIRVWELAFTSSFFASSNLAVPGIHINIYTLHHSSGYLFSLVHFAQRLSFAARKLTGFVADINLHEVYRWELRKWRLWGSHGVGAGGIPGDEKSCASCFWKRCLSSLLRSLIYLGLHSLWCFLFFFLTQMSKISHSAHQPRSPWDEEGMILMVPHHPRGLNPRDWPLMYSQLLIESWGPVEKASCYGSPETEDTKKAAGSWSCLVLCVCDEQGL